ncbi:pirin family protein [Ruegeria sp. R14_0]|uniref:pirin family protein n=1 Tax=Ruegeria sp. R14_0 TaxID=2821100 RepID=UPI001ADADE1B|nr:pirin family protein [Ruegeria sp. R14_0]MBO9447574.1 pirin family protein [Ruegeria sp. R14_0]
MQMIRPSEERGAANFGWLDSKHSFSFGQYLDPNHMGFGPLRVINEDRVAPGAGFGTHGHADMEIISVVLDGALEHKDSMGQNAVIRPGEVQRMSAGTGVRHSEYNASKTDPVHFLQIWIVPEREGLRPSYEQKAFPEIERQDTLRLLGSRDGRGGSITIHQDVDLYGATLSAGKELQHEIAAGRGIWVQVIRGALTANGSNLATGDGFAVANKPLVTLKASDDTEILLFDMNLS